MDKNWVEDPDSLWHTSGLGREEFVQKLLSTLVFGHADHRWNVPGAPSDRGRKYLVSLSAEHFGGALPDGAQFVDEFELPRRYDDERAGWPDQAVISADALLLIELKTEKASHRPGQLAHYLDLAAHHHPERAIDLLYITPAMEVPEPHPVPSRARYGHAAWREVAPLIADTWGGSSVEWERTVAERLAWWLDEVGAQRALPPRLRPSPAPEVEIPAEDAVDIVLGEAAAVQRTGQQSAVDLWPGSPDQLEEIRLRTRDRLRGRIVIDGVLIANVLPWLWSAGSSGGQPLTDAGRIHGYELRLSRYAKDLW